MASRGQSLRSNELASLLGSTGGEQGSSETQSKHLFAPSFAGGTKKSRDLRPEQSSTKVASAPKTRYRRGRGGEEDDSSSDSDDEDVFDGLAGSKGDGDKNRSDVSITVVAEELIKQSVPVSGHINTSRRRRRRASSSSNASNSSEASSSSSSSSSEDEDAVEERRRRIRERAELQQRRRRFSSSSSTEHEEGLLVRATEVLNKKNDELKGRARLSVSSSSSEGESSSSEDESSSSSEESKSDDDATRRSKPVFIPKSKRGTVILAEVEAEKQAAITLKRKDTKDKRAKESRLMVAQLLQKATDKNQAKKGDDGWIAMPDDDDDGPNCDEKLEYENWEARELLRILREIDEAEDEENELLELERRRNMTEADRWREDEALGKFQRKNKPKGEFMQRYYHKGAFYMDENSLKDKTDVRHKAEEYARAATGEDKYDKKNLPEVMQVQKFGMSGYSTKYKGLAKEDTTDRAMQYIPAKRRKGGPDDNLHPRNRS